MSKFQSITDFVEEHIEGEPLNTKAVAGAIKKYIHSNIDLSDSKKVMMYEKFLYRLALAAETNDNELVGKLLFQVSNWVKARKINEPDEYKKRYLLNTSTINLNKID